MKNRHKKEVRLKELGALLLSPEVLKNPKQYATISKEYKKLKQIIQQYEARDKILKEINDAKELIKSTDEQMQEIGEILGPNP